MSKLLILSKQLGRAVSRDVLDSHFEIVERLPDEYTLNDLVVFSHHKNEVSEISKYQGRVITWYWDNHWNTDKDNSLIARSSVNIPAHSFPKAHIEGPKPRLPLCCSQWGQQTLNKGHKYLLSDRHDELFGGYSMYRGAPRNSFLRAIVNSSIPNDLKLHQPKSLGIYWAKSELERFLYWAKYKTSLCLPVRYDLSCRFFDALLAGQIPIVAPDIYDLNDIVSLPSQDLLPVVRLEKYSISALEKAYTKALALFARGGVSGIIRRHRFVVNNHCLRARIYSLLSKYI